MTAKKEPRIVYNAVRCLQCGQVIVSTHRHDFRWCHCKNIAVDGGRDYLKRSGGRYSYEELSRWDKK